MPSIAIGMALKRIRVISNKTQKQVARAVGVSGKTISYWEIGKAEPDKTFIAKLNKYLKCNLRQISENPQMPGILFSMNLNLQNEFTKEPDDDLAKTFNKKEHATFKIDNGDQIVYKIHKLEWGSHANRKDWLKLHEELVVLKVGQDNFAAVYRLNVPEQNGERLALVLNPVRGCANAKACVAQFETHVEMYGIVVAVFANRRQYQ